ncbi:hypothetical protein DXX92_08560 [Thalassotalea euphylliae]|uniref:Uncharacterized protein n=2 Tax=Thalassotalea euphylliae TaxID=1655234 RepID=A0A3E0UEW4_9GAMM|nr:hypothetical protein DXX92_08560 [Thalassotalea euphylliae]
MLTAALTYVCLFIHILTQYLPNKTTTITKSRAIKMFARCRQGLAVALLTCSFSQFATPFTQQAKQSIAIPHTNLNAVIDGDLSDPVWQQAKVISLDNVTSPYENTPSPVKTEARIIDNGKELLVAFIAHDPNPDKMISSIGERDTKWFDDVVGIIIDPLNNRRLSYNFFVNPYGVQNDETFNEITGLPNELWDGIWHSYGKVTEFGYQVEMAIPYQILNFDENKSIQQWPFELVRIYPREQRLRISSVKLDRDNACWLCQYPMAEGFEQAEIGENLQITPALVASYDEQRDIYDPQSDWQSETDVEASLDLRWGITPKTLFNATLNPDFSTVEADAGQLKVNNKFSLFFDEKRSFFLENQHYFESITDLVYTRNIADPDYGAKLTGSQGSHNFGAFVSHDEETNFILSGNLSANIASLDTESHSGALRYLYDINQDVTLGVISTFRRADDYHNYVTGLDGSYRINGANSLKFQWLASDTEYPQDLFTQFCRSNCSPNEQVLRSQKDGSFSDNAYQIKYLHDSEYWTLDAQRQWYGEDFRADLGFINRVDYVNDQINVVRSFYQDEQALWSTIDVGSKYAIQHNENGELINREQSFYAFADGPLLSRVELIYVDANKVGLRQDSSNLSIDGNTKRFNEKQWRFFGQLRPNNKTYVSLEGTLGEKIDYDNDRLGDIVELIGNVTWHPNPHLEIDLYHTYSELDADSQNVFTANLTDLRLRYYFDVQSSLKLSLVYQDIDYNPDNNPLSFFSEQERSLATQLIYAYKLNPHTVFFLGYSDNSFEDDFIGSLKQERRTIFTKISYAWR